MQAWHAEGDGRVLAAMVMPDHVHVLFQLGTKLGVGQWVGRWKSAVARATGRAAGWQRDFWEHRLRDDEPWEDHGLYLFLNPHRAGLARRGELWPWWWAPEPQVLWFLEMLNADGTPPPEWIAWPDERFAKLGVGE